MKTLREFAACALAFAPVLLLPGRVIAQDCVRIDSDPPQASLTLKLSSYQSRVAPATYCSLQKGVTYRLTVSAKNHETRTLKLSLNNKGEPRFKGMRTSHFLRSLVLPGWGQASLGYGGRTTTTVVNLLATGLTTYQRWQQWETAQSNRDLYQELLGIATTPAQEQQVSERLYVSNRNTDAYEEAFLISAAWTGWWYLDNLFEAWYYASPPKVSRGEDGLNTLRTPHVGKGRAFLQSFLWPGEGQLYRGHHSRGVFFQWGTIVCGLFAIDRKLLYDLREIDYEATAAMADTTSDPTQAALLGALAQVKKSDADQLQQEFWIWTGAAAGVWLVNIFDILLSGGAPDYPGRFESDVSWRSGTLYTGLRMRLP